MNINYDAPPLRCNHPTGHAHGRGKEVCPYFHIESNNRSNGESDDGSWWKGWWEKRTAFSTCVSLTIIAHAQVPPTVINLV